MKTFHHSQVIVMFVVGGFLGLTGCGSDAPGRPVDSQRVARLGPQAEAPSVASPQDPPTRPTTKEGCDACQGLWATHGIEPDETCICKTSDEGNECIDGKACQGECLLDGDPEFHVMDQGDPARGYYKGHCAGYDTTFGCFRHIPDDIQTQLPLTASEAAEVICVD
jgi:hypothetical protein